MRLIDADEIDFNKAFGSKSGFAKDMRKAAQMLVDKQPTAFDINTVMEHLKKELELADDEKSRCIKENPTQFDEAKGYARGIATATDAKADGIFMRVCWMKKLNPR